MSLEAYLEEDGFGYCETFLSAAEALAWLASNTPSVAILDYTQGDDVLSGGAGDDQVYGAIGRDTVYGGGGNDLVSGLRDDDLLYAGEGSDTIWSGAGNDIAYGGAGNDVIYGSLGNDRFYGEAGADTFIFEAGWGVDEIVGFSFLEGDRIALAGQSYSIRDTAEGMALDLSGGGSIVLHNIEPLAFSTAFLV
jgi:Ca2+-binding RTX toxin-like protein